MSEPTIGQRFSHSANGLLADQGRCIADALQMLFISDCH
jgi:hypothetical protein